MNAALPFVDLTPQNSLIENEFHSKVINLIKKGPFIYGPEVASFEKEFSAFCKTAFCIGVGNGTDALELAFKSLNLSPGDEVILPGISYFATASAIIKSGATPRFADIGSDFNLDPTKIESLINVKTRAICVVHLYGKVAPIIQIMKIAKAHNLKVIEDCSHSHGAEIESKKVGSFGDLGCFSFYPTKNLGALGDAGAITCNDSEFFNKIKTLKNNGAVPESKYQHTLIGQNSRLDEIQAMVLNIKLKYLDDWNKNRISTAKKYKEALAHISDLILPEFKEDGSHVYHLYVIKSWERDELRKKMEKDGIQTGIHYPIPMHRQIAAMGFLESDVVLPNTDELAKTCLSLPMFYGITDDQIEKVSQSVASFYK